MAGAVVEKAPWQSNWPMRWDMFILTAVQCTVQLHYIFKKNTDWSDEKEVTEALNEIHLHFEYNPKSEQSEIF